MTRPRTTDSIRHGARAGHPLALHAGALAVLLLGCPQLRDDSFGRSGAEGGQTASAGSGGSSQGRAGGEAGANAGSSGSGSDAGAGGTPTAGGTDAGGTGGSAGVAGDGGSSGTSSAMGCTFGDFSTPELLAGLGRSDALYGPSLSNDGLTLAFSESIADGPEDIYLAARGDVAAAFGSALPANGVNTGDSEGTGFLSGSALTLYFFSDRSGGPGGRDIYRATRSDELDDFADIRPVEGVNGDADDHMPWLSSDERIIYFASNRAADSGSTNLWLSQRSSAQDGFEPPREVAGVNSDDRDISPSLTADQRILFFCSDRGGGAGSDDIWMATRDDPAADFGAPQPVPVINDTSSELNAAISRDGREIIFSSNRDGGRKLFRSVRSCL